jgi:hypothetical protein
MSETEYARDLARRAIEMVTSTCSWVQQVHEERLEAEREVRRLQLRVYAMESAAREARLRVERNVMNRERRAMNRERSVMNRERSVMIQELAMARRQTTELLARVCCLECRSEVACCGFATCRCKEVTLCAPCMRAQTESTSRYGRCPNCHDLISPELLHMHVRVERFADQAAEGGDSPPPADGEWTVESANDRVANGDWAAATDGEWTVESANDRVANGDWAAATDGEWTVESANDWAVEVDDDWESGVAAQEGCSGAEAVPTQVVGLKRVKAHEER